MVLVLFLDFASLTIQVPEETDVNKTFWATAFRRIKWF